jgi:hypothetical protein
LLSAWSTLTAPRDGGQLYAARQSDFNLLIENSCIFIRQEKGDHENSQSPITQRRFMVDSFIKSRDWANHTLRRAGLPKAF